MNEITNKKLLSKKGMNYVAIALLASIVTIYAVDTYQASSEFINLILVFPLVLAILILLAVVALKEFRRVEVVQVELESLDERPEAPEVVVSDRKSFQAIALFVAYILSLNWLGFDLGTIIYTAIFLVMQGERRVSWILIYSILLGLCLSAFFSFMLPYPMPLVIL